MNKTPTFSGSEEFINYCKERIDLAHNRPRLRKYWETQLSSAYFLRNGRKLYK